MFRLSDDDGRAVDMLLDSAASSNGNGAQAGLTAQPAPFRQRLESVESILNILKQMPPMDPPRNLVAKTLANIERKRGKRPAKIPAAQSDQQQHRRPQA